MRVLMCSLLSAALALGVSGCQLVYKLPTRQGNVIEQQKLDQLEVGMTRDQVRFLLGTPLAASPYDGSRWDYLGYYRAPRGAISERVISLYFDGDRLTRTEGAEPRTRDGGQALAQPDLEQLSAEEEKQAVEDERYEETH